MGKTSAYRLLVEKLKENVQQVKQMEKTRTNRMWVEKTEGKCSASKAHGKNKYIQDVG
jgi:hypothetical protein